MSPANVRAPFLHRSGPRWTGAEAGCGVSLMAGLHAGTARVLAPEADLPEDPYRNHAEPWQGTGRRVGKVLRLRYRAVPPRTRTQPDGLPEMRPPSPHRCARTPRRIPGRRWRRA